MKVGNRTEDSGGTVRYPVSEKEDKRSILGNRKLQNA
jgi:hypothetical protein